MATVSTPSRNLKRTTLIYGVVQGFLLLLLLLMAFQFQRTFAMEGRPDQFYASVACALVLELLLFYPVNRFARSEVRRDLVDDRPGLSAEEQNALRKRRIVSDFVKASLFVFCLAFILLVPAKAGGRMIYAATFFSFILTLLMYFQCYNFAAKKELQPPSA